MLPTEEQFLKYLEALLRRIELTTPYPKGCTRFTYFNSELSLYLRPDLEDYKGQPRITELSFHDLWYEEQHKKGNSQAIFLFAKANRAAITSDWVTKQLMEWRLSNSKKKFECFVRAYWSEHGHRKLETTVAEIRRDQAIYQAYIKDYVNGTASRKNLERDEAKKHGMSLHGVKETLKYYGQAYKQWRKSKIAKIWLSLQRPSSTPSGTIRSRARARLADLR